MLPSCRIPTPITAVYIFAIINLTALLNLKLVEANVLVNNKFNMTVRIIRDNAARFGPLLSEEGLEGRVIYTEPKDACLPVAKPPKPHPLGWIALIKRYDCDFTEKVLNAQHAGYVGAIVHNVGSDELISMGGNPTKDITIPSVFIGEFDAKQLAFYSNLTGIWVIIDNSTYDDFGGLIREALIFGGATMGLALVIGWTIMIVKWIKDVRKKKRSRLSLEHLKKIPVKKFKKGDEYDICAICLDEYEDGDKLRILPCSHAYHQKCIDPWLTKNKRTCPICKRKVIPGDNDDSDTDSDNEDSDSGGASENTPLLGAIGGYTSSARSQSFDSSGLPETVREHVRHANGNASSSDEDEDLPSSIYQSSVEVHSTCGTHGNRSYGAMATVTMDNETINGNAGDHAGYEDLDSEPLLRSRGDQELGVISGLDNHALAPVDDHFGGEHQDDQMQTSASDVSSADEADMEDLDPDAVAVVRVATLPKPSPPKRGAEIV